MFRPIALAGSFLALIALSAPADDTIAPETVVAVKRATVFVQVAGPTWKGTGSGFVVAADKDGVLIATNHHVIANPEKKVRPTPTELAKSLKQVKVSVVFDSGAKGETTMKAEPIAADPDNDLAILRVTGVREQPKPIAYTAQQKLIETTPVYTFGFPFGKALSTSGGNPAITVGRGTVSSIRTDENGEPMFVQIDGAINPGNSGGPVVDAKGQLVGVAVMRIKDGPGIGLAIPAGDLVRLMKGRLGSLQATANRGTNNRNTIHVDVEVADPTNAIRSVSVNYLVVPAGTKVPNGPLDRQPGVKKQALAISDGVASGDVIVTTPGGTLLLQAVPDGGAGSAGVTPVRTISLGAGNEAVADDSPSPPVGNSPPSGWVVYTPPDKTYTVWLPEKVKWKASEHSNTARGQTMKLNSLVAELPGGSGFLVDEIIFPGINTQADRAVFDEIIRDMLTNEGKFRIVSELNVRMGTVPGKEYRVEAGRATVRVRVFISGNWVLLLHVVGSAAAVDSDDARTFLTSCRVTPKSKSGGVFAGIDPDRMTKIQGGFNDPEFLDEGPEGGLLVGAEVAIGKFNNYPVAHASRPIYRVGDREVLGKWHGPTADKEIIRSVAKPGYAVGAITIKNGLTVDGYSFTYMRVKNGRLDPSDSYESQWLGGPGGSSKATLGGSGTPVVGLIGKSKANAVTGLGLLYEDSSQDSPAIVPMPTRPQSNPDPATAPQNAPPESTSSPPRANTAPKPDATQTASAPGASEPAKDKSGNTVVIIILVVVGILGVGTIILVAVRYGASDSGDEDDEDDDRPRRKKRSKRRRD